MVVGADLLALVAAEEVVADHCGLFGSEFTFKFYGEVGDASGCVEFTWFNEGAGGAAIKAVGAASAEVRERRFVVGYLFVDEQFSEKNVCAGGGDDEKGVFSCFSDTGMFSPGFFEDGGAVDGYCCVEIFSEKGFEVVEELLQLFTDNGMVVVNEGVFGNDRLSGNGIDRIVVADCCGDDGFQVGEQHRGHGPFVQSMFHISHLSMTMFSNHGVVALYGDRLRDG